MIKQEVLKMVTLLHQEFSILLSSFLLQNFLFVPRMKFLQNYIFESFIISKAVNLTFRLYG